MIERTTDNPTGYTAWDGTALWGKHRPGKLERFPALNGILTAPEFHDRFRSLGANCEVWTGEETGFECEAACDNLRSVCGGQEPQDCLAVCDKMPRALSECLATTDTCPSAGEVCQISEPWVQLPQ